MTGLVKNTNEAVAPDESAAQSVPSKTDMVWLPGGKD